MDTNVIPLKTEAGATEIRTRAMRLDARLRSLLILVDGHKPLSNLQAALGDGAEENLRRLRELGLVTWDDSLSSQMQRPS
ncbi:hypothetical protein [Viridibacterium curvum]|uniref:hypothetical protein n=1 Tax=Viridibacterium curvum TaxID=1101404 RepID=UPI0031E7551A